MTKLTSPKQRFKLRNKVLIAALAAIGLATQAVDHDWLLPGDLYKHRSSGLGVSNQSPNEPTNIQWVGNATFSQASPNPTKATVTLVDPTEQGDTAYVLGNFGSSSDVISAISDDAGGTLANNDWVKDKVQPDAGHGQSVCILRRSNCPAGLYKITITFSGQTGFFQFGSMKVNCIAPFSPVVTSTGANPSATTAIAAGNMTTTVDDCFWVYVAVNSSPGTPAVLGRFAAPASTNDFSATLCCCAAPDYFTGMYGMKRSQGTFNPTMTAGSSWVGSAVASVCYKTAPGVGSRPLVSYGGRVKWQMNLNNATWINGSANYGTTHTWDVPWDEEVNGIALTYDDPNSNFMGTTPNWAASHVSSSPSNTWKAPAPQECGTVGGGGPFVGFVHCVNGSFSRTMTISQTFVNAPSHATPAMQTLVFGLVGVGEIDTASTQGFGANPNVSVPVTRSNVLASALTPPQDYAVVLFHIQEDQQTVSAVTATNGGAPRLQLDDPGVYEGVEGIHDGGIGHMYHVPGNGPYNFSISYVNYESGLNLTNYGGQWVCLPCLGPLRVTDYSRFPERRLRR